MTSLERVVATRYVTPLREGGSLPALVEASDLGHYVVKFRGAGQGPLALVAEVICGRLARTLGLPVPDLALVELDPRLAAAEPDPEIQDLLAASAGDNLGFDFLPGALPLGTDVDGAFAADVVWFDGLITNVDRTARNPNLLRWHGRPYLIDHGAALYAQHRGGDFAAAADADFALIGDHVLLGVADPISEADVRLAARVGDDAVRDAVEAVPDAWLIGPSREAYAEHLRRRAAGPRTWVAAAEEARTGG